MRIIHTADWHLGKILNGHRFIEDQRYILSAFTEAMDEEKPDVIVISGDIYDTSYPSKETIQLFENTLYDLNIQRGIPVIITNGNHDGRERLHYGADWFERHKCYIRTELEDMKHPIDIKGVNFFPLPFATIGELQSYFEDTAIEQYDQGTQRCIDEMKPYIDETRVNILIGHLTVQGGQRTESERPLSIGTIESVAERTFKDFDNVLLGHLHHPFSITSDFIKYSGSLLQYSFSEADQVKGYRVIDIVSKEDIKDRFVPLKPKRVLEVIEGDYEAVIQGDVHVSNKENYFHFKLKHMSHVNDPMMHLKQIYPNTLALTNTTFTEHQSEVVSHIEKQSDAEIIRSFYKAMTDEALTDTQQQHINHILESQLKGE